jgi:hypothetical protein
MHHPLLPFLNILQRVYKNRKKKYHKSLLQEKCKKARAVGWMPYISELDTPSMKMRKGQA